VTLSRDRKRFFFRAVKLDTLASMNKFRRLVKALIPRSIFRVIEPHGHWGEAVLANIRYGFPARGMKVIGVTGTDGKTTTTMMIWTMLRESGYKAGCMTTVGYGSPTGYEPSTIHMTSLQAFPLMRRIRQLKQEGAEWLVLESSSHALAQNRLWGVPYSVAVMTNVTGDHLDYHGTFERYREAKWKLFKLAGQNKKGLQTGVVNVDDSSGELYASSVKKAIRYGIKHGDLKATKIEPAPDGSRFLAKLGRQEMRLTVLIPGKFNVYNALAAAGAGLAVGLSPEQIEKGIAAVKGVEGRMNFVDEGQNFSVIIDYASTPVSFEKVLSEIRPLTKGRLIVVFGSAGRRDEAKRAIQGEIAGRYADVAVITEEDDRDVDGLEIMHQIADGAKRAGKVFRKDLFMIHERDQAIEFAIKAAGKGDTVMLLGKGHEKTIERADGEHPWNESDVARKAIKATIAAEFVGAAKS
jgi:UDP-N-acetylmuramoyl-L-alanyl-D-glutamate--2,6-diaminopimelate ligase